MVDYLIVIEAKLYNKKGNFIIDTGSETSILNKVHFSALYEHQKKDQTASSVLQSIDNLYEKQVKQFALKNFKIDNKASHVIDLPHIKTNKKIKMLGISGYNILKDYELFIDLYLNQITLTKTDATEYTLDKHVYLEKIIDSLDFKLKNQTIILNATINDQKLIFELDTAAEFNKINVLTKKHLNTLKPTKRLVLTDTNNKKIEVLVGKLYHVKLSESVYFYPINTVLTNLKKNE